MGFKERIEEIQNPLSKEEVENLFFKNEETFTQILLKGLQETNAVGYLTRFRDEVLIPEQNPIFKKVFTVHAESPNPKSLIRSILDYGAKRLTGLARRQWEFTQITLEQEEGLEDKLLKKYNFDSISSHLIFPKEKEISDVNTWVNSYEPKGFGAIVELWWEENNEPHMISISIDRLPPPTKGFRASVETQSLVEEIWFDIRDDFPELDKEVENYIRKHEKKKYSNIYRTKSSSEIEIILAHAYLKSRHDRDLEERLKKMDKELDLTIKRFIASQGKGQAYPVIVPVPIPIGPSLATESIFQQIAISRATERLGEIERLIRRL